VQLLAKLSIKKRPLHAEVSSYFYAFLCLGLTDLKPVHCYGDWQYVKRRDIKSDKSAAKPVRVIVDAPDFFIINEKSDLVTLTGHRVLIDFPALLELVPLISDD
jgi:hypothetical protein